MSDITKPAPTPSSLAALLARAKQEHRSGNFAAAEPLYGQAIAAAPAGALEAQRLLGILLMQTGRTDRAVEAFAAAVRLAPGNPDLLNDLARASLTAGRADDAIAAYRQASIQAPDSAEILVNLGNVLGQQGRFAEAAQAYRRALALAPGALHAHINLAVMLQHQGENKAAIDALRRALTLDPRSFEAHFNLGVALAAERRFAEAAELYRAACAIAPGAAPPLVNLGKALEGMQEVEAAISAYRRAASLAPTLAEVHNALGSALSTLGRHDDAVAAHREALRRAPDAAALHVDLGLALEQQKKAGEAIACYERAIALDPAGVAAYNNLGSLLCDEGRPEEAVTVYRTALALNPDVAQIHVNLGAVLGDLERRDEALAALDRAIALAPSFAAPHLARALVLGGSTVDESFASFRRHGELRNREAASARQPRTVPHKARHDREQLRYMIERGIVDGAAPGIGEALADDLALARLFDGLHHIEGGARLPGPAINPGNSVARIEGEWSQRRPQVVVIDDLLTPEALAALQRFCWGSTIWRQPYSGGYLGAFPQAGFASPLLAQIVEELRLRFRGIFGDNLLTTCWGFKYDTTLSGINVHADLAEVNVNFWITPDEANLDPESGGLVVWDVPAPLDWDFDTYNNNEAAIRDFIARSDAKSITVPYRCNRALLFDSDLFHQTDRLAFKEGYLNRRINLTLLYGVRENDASIRLAAKRLAKYEW